MKIIAFAQLHDELRKGNLENWYRSVVGCDFVYVFDQASTDGSREVYEKDDRTTVILNPTNNFSRELECKATLLELVLSEHPDVDWIFWLDGDTVLDGRLADNEGRGFRELCREGTKERLGSYRLGHYNLWRSDTYYRLDNKFHGLHTNGVCALWRNSGNLSFSRLAGLHLTTTPNGVGRGKRVDFSLIHRGFATDAQILEKHQVYGSRGQKGWELDRLVDETTLEVAQVPSIVLPSWYPLNDGGASPIGKRPLVELLAEAQK